MASALRDELQSLRTMQLHARAAAAGVGAELLEDAMDSVQPKEPLIALLVARQGRDTAQKRAEPEASGGEAREEAQPEQADRGGARLRRRAPCLRDRVLWQRVREGGRVIRRGDVATQRRERVITTQAEPILS